MPRRKRQANSDLGEFLWYGFWILAFGLLSNVPWLKAVAYLLVGIVIVILAWRAVRYFRITRPLSISQVDSMSGVEFERFIAKLLTHQGYVVKRIGGLDDFGVDLIASRGDRTHAIQVKRWSQPVTIEAVRAAIAGMNFHRCDRAVVITNSEFTKPAKDLARGTNCRLIDREMLAEEIRAWQEKERAG
jgi:restriction system protein